MNKPDRKTRISTQLMLLFAGLALAIVLVLAFVLNKLATERSEDELGHQFAEIALQTTDKLDRTLFERYREVRLLSIQAGLAGSGHDVDAKRRFLEEMQKTYPYYAWLGLTDTEGKVLVSANGLLEGANVAARPWFKNAFEGKHLTDVHEAALLSKLLQPAGADPMRFIDIAFPYHDAAGRLAGALGAHLSIDWARDIEQSVMLPLLTRRRLEALVVGQDMTVIIGPRELIGTRLAPTGVGAGKDFWQAAPSGHAVAAFGDGKTYLVGYSKSQGHSFSPGLNWTVLVRQEAGEAYAPIAQFRRQVIVIGLVIALLSAALAALLARRISRPLGVLAEAARRIEAGESRDIDEVPGGYREIGMLRIALQSLIGKLQANETAMRQAARRKDEFLATLAHELRNPLAPISVAAELLTMAPADAARQKNYGEMIGRQTRHMTDMIDDLLDVSRVTRGEVNLERRPCVLQEVLAEAVEQVAPLVATRKHRLAQAIVAEPVVVLGDRTRLVQVVANLLNNAAKYTPEGGRIDLALAVDPGRARLTVRDNGIGMSADLMEHAFELFTQETRKTDLSLGGLGVGLALSKQLVTLHDGSLSVSSGGQGMGSAFTVSLPLLHAGADLPAAGPAADQQASRAGGPVLIVDDNADAADTLGLLVGSFGYEVLVEYGPVAGLEQARARRPAVCLLDIGMPVMDGYELAARLRTLPGMQDALLLAVTGYSQDSDRQRARTAGFDEHLAKPVDVERLKSLLTGPEALAHD
ncbi:response regulator [Massilia sp. UMI-21]|nr:response regulator [Massilia sp. UMI-21]